MPQILKINAIIENVLKEDIGTFFTCKKHEDLIQLFLSKESSYRSIIKLLRSVNYKVFNFDKKIDHNYDKIMESNYLSNFYAIETSLGDSLFKSISIILCGTEDFYILLKVLCLYILYEYELFFKRIFLQTESVISFKLFFEKFLNSDSVSDVYLLIFSVLLARPIKVYSLQMFTKKSISYNLADENIFKFNAINLCLLRDNFVPVLSCNSIYPSIIIEESNLNKNKTSLFINSYSIS